MCFEIDLDNQHPWKQRTAWKLLWLCPDGSLESQYAYTKSVEWNHPGQVVVASRGPRWYIPFGHTASRHGIYVYRTKQRAESVRLSRRSLTDFVLFKVLVSPADFLYHSIDNTMATYSRVTIAKQQPHIQWEAWK